VDNDDWTRLYRLLAGLGLDAPQVPVTIQPKPGKPAIELPLGWPDLKVGIGFDHSPIQQFERADWTVIRMSATTAAQLPPALTFLDELAFAHAMRQSEQGAEQSISKTENTVLEALVRAGLPMPDRNHEVRHEADGRLLTIPDFVWHDIQLAVWVDGHHFHGGSDLLALMKQVQDDPKRRDAVKQRWKNKSARDADTRRYMTALGWTVIAVSDKTVDDGASAVAEAVTEIVATYHRLSGGAAG
jgi:G:T-mismatch repair DNA endonuclease (very short patch repair protein)